MSKYFVLPTEGVGPGGDIVWRKRKKLSPDDRPWYYLYVGDVLLGEVAQGGEGSADSWWGCSRARGSEFFGIRAMCGFARRWDASKFVIQHHGYWMQNVRESRKYHEEALERLRAKGVKVSDIQYGMGLDKTSL
jgi:hypothetical protein